jgi:hypothetical protein
MRGCMVKKLMKIKGVLNLICLPLSNLSNKLKLSGRMVPDPCFLLELRVLFHILPGILVISVVLHQASIVESSIINLEDVLVALAPHEALRHLEEVDEGFVGAVGDALRVTAE